jgi:hypothetical protein
MASMSPNGPGHLFDDTLTLTAKRGNPHDEEENRRSGVNGPRYHASFGLFKF